MSDGPRHGRGGIWAAGAITVGIAWLAQEIPELMTGLSGLGFSHGASLVGLISLLGVTIGAGVGACLCGADVVWAAATRRGADPWQAPSRAFVVGAVVVALLAALGERSLPADARLARAACVAIFLLAAFLAGAASRRQLRPGITSALVVIVAISVVLTGLWTAIDPSSRDGVWRRRMMLEQTRLTGAAFRILRPTWRARPPEPLPTAEQLAHAAWSDEASLDRFLPRRREFNVLWVTWSQDALPIAHTCSGFADRCATFNSAWPAHADRETAWHAALTGSYPEPHSDAGTHITLPAHLEAAGWRATQHAVDGADSACRVLEALSVDEKWCAVVAITASDARHAIDELLVKASKRIDWRRTVVVAHGLPGPRYELATGAVPLWLRVPGIGRRTIEETVELVDVPATLSDLLGVPLDGTHGQSLLGLVVGAQVLPRCGTGPCMAAFVQGLDRGDRRWEAVVVGRWTCLVRGDQTHLIDRGGHDVDPDELADVEARLAALLGALHERACAHQ